MKKIEILSFVIIALAITMQTAVKAQEASKAPKSELKTNLFGAVMALPEISYERLLENNTSVGLAIGFGLGNDDDFSRYKFLAIPHYRVYFGKNDIAGFFIEANAGLASVRETADYWIGMTTVEYEFTRRDFGLGGAIGAKFLTRNGLLGEIFAGAGRFIGENRSVEAYPRLGVTVGKRF